MQLTDEQQVLFKIINPKTSKGKPATISPTPKWSATNPLVVSITPSSDSLTCLVKGIAPGNSQIVITIGTLSPKIIDIEVIAAPLATFEIGFGPVELQP